MLIAYLLWLISSAFLYFVGISYFPKIGNKTTLILAIAIGWFIAAIYVVYRLIRQKAEEAEKKEAEEKEEEQKS